ncbi:MAG: DASS family sodium-coupled anion symporter [Comamonadaceae bacterium]|nr:DASS family sodium-coupled anion symporter [Comamonadaceae bacterium]
MPKIGLVAAFIVLLSIVFMPPIAGLPQAGQMMLGILAFAVIVWMTEALDYSVSALLIGSLMIGLLAISPVPGKEGADAVMMGTKAALPYALGGFSNSAVVLVAAACFIAAAMTATRLDQRIALQVLSYVPARANHVVMGAILVGFLLSFIVPSATARVACLMPIMLGFLTAFGADRRSKFAALVVITAAQTASVWNVGIKTAAAQNMVAIGFIERQFGETITWGEWFVAGAPFSACLTVLLYFIMTRMLKPEMDHLAGGREAVRQQLQALGKMTANQWKLLVITLVLLGFWATEGVLHKVDTTSSTIVAVTLMLMPRIGIMSWKESQKGFPWGTVVLFAVGIAMGSALLKTQAAPWLAKQIVENLGLVNASAFAILMLLSMFLIVIHLGFASATALASTMIPIVISVLQVVETPGINAIGITMLLQFVVSFGFILPVNSPQGMLAYGTDTFTIKQYVKTGFVITIAATVLLVIFALTYWPMMGYMTLK